VSAVHVQAPKLPKRAVSNRKNAQKSTGPQSAVGKRRSSGNALRHGYNTAPDPSATLDHLRHILSDPTADVASSLQTEIGRAALALALADARLDRILEDRSILQVTDKHHEAEAELMVASMPRHRSRNKNDLWMKAALTFLLRCNKKSRKTFQIQLSQQSRYLDQAHAARRKALLNFIDAEGNKLQNEAE
jgi:hypothetical protein